MSISQALQRRQITTEMMARLNAGEALTLIDIELFCLRVTIKLQTQGAFYSMSTYLDVGDCLDAIYIDGKIVHGGRDLQTEVNEYIKSIEDKFRAVVDTFQI